MHPASQEPPTCPKAAGLPAYLPTPLLLNSVTKLQLGTCRSCHVTRCRSASALARKASVCLAGSSLALVGGARFQRKTVPEASSDSS